MNSSIKNLIASTKLRTNSKKEERALTKSVSRTISLRGSRKASVNIEDVRERQEQSVVEELRVLLSATNDLPPHLDDYHILLRYVPMHNSNRYTHEIAKWPMLNVASIPIFRCPSEFYVFSELLTQHLANNPIHSTLYLTRHNIIHPFKVDLQPWN